MDGSGLNSTTRVRDTSRALVNTVMNRLVSNFAVVS
jgi:hypothetical protein